MMSQTWDNLFIKLFNCYIESCFIDYFKIVHHQCMTWLQILVSSERKYFRIFKDTWICLTETFDTFPVVLFSPRLKLSIVNNNRSLFSPSKEINLIPMSKRHDMEINIRFPSINIFIVYFGIFGNFHRFYLLILISAFATTLHLFSNLRFGIHLFQSFSQQIPFNRNLQVVGLQHFLIICFVQQNFSF